MLDRIQEMARARKWCARSTGFEPGVTPWAIDVISVRMGRDKILIQQLGTDKLYTTYWEVSPQVALHFLGSSKNTDLSHDQVYNILGPPESK